MSDEPKCPPKVWLIIDQARGHVLSTWTEEPSRDLVEYSAKHGAYVVEYIPRHVADQKARDAVRQALEAERAARHREDRE